MSWGTACLRQYNEGPKYAGVTLLRHLLGVALAVVFVVNGGGYQSALIGMSLGAALPGAYALIIALRRSGIELPNIPALKAYLLFGFPVAVVSSTATFFAMSTQSLLAIFAGMEFAGYFAAAQSLASRTLRLPMDTLSRVVGPSVFEELEVRGTASSDAMLERYFSFLMLIAVPIVVALVCAADVFANLMFEPAFASQTEGYLRVLALASLVFRFTRCLFELFVLSIQKNRAPIGHHYLLIGRARFFIICFHIFDWSDGGLTGFFSKWCTWVYRLLSLWAQNRPDHHSRLRSG